MTRRSPALRIGLLALGSLLAVGSVLLSKSGESGRGSASEGRPRGIVLVCLDTLRADGVSLPGEAEGPMPRLQAMAKDATVFVDATASSAWTEPSIASLLTGLRPSHHGMMSYFRASALVSSVDTLAERLRSAGWSTGAITGGGWITPELGFGQGFDSFGANFDQVRPETAVEAWDKARKKDRPFFLFVHTYAAHDPYGLRGWLHGGASRLHTTATLTPAQLSEGLNRGGGRVPDDLLPLFGMQFLTDPRGRRLCQETLGAPRYDALLPDLMPWYEGGYAAPGDRSVLEGLIRDSYRSGLRCADEAIDDVWTALSRRGLLDDADVIITGDHGECFGEHKTLWHGLHLHDESIRVPMLMHVRGSAPGTRIVHGACDLTDVAPTILELAGLPPESGFDGRSLLALAEGAQPGRTAVAELERVRDHMRPEDGRICMFSARSTQWKWILQYDPEDATLIREALYHLTTDPKEESPLAVGAELPPDVGDEFRRVVETERARLRRLATPASRILDAVQVR